MFCKKCGQEIAPNVKFCTKCGAPVEVPSVSLPKISIPHPPKKEISKKKKIIMSVCAAVCLIAVVALSIVISNYNQTKDMKKAIKSRSAYSITHEYALAYNDSSKLKKYDKLIAELIEDIKKGLDDQDFSSSATTNGRKAVDNYVDENWGSVNDLSAAVSSSNKAKYNELLELLDSKEYYCAGVYESSAGNYDDAIKNFSYVASSDKLYDDAQTKLGECVDSYIKSVLTEVDKCIAENDISGGLDLLEKAQSYLENCNVDSTEIKTKCDEVLKTYAASYAQKADDAFKQHDASAAVGNMKIAMEMQPDNGDYKTAYDKYQQYLPFYLYDKQNIFSVSKDYRIKTEKSINANDGTEHKNCLEYRYYKDCNDGTIKFLLDGKYDTVTGTLFSPKVNVEVHRTGSAHFEVYGDGKLIYTSTTISAESRATNISFAVTGIQKLEIKFVGSNSSVWGFDAQYYGDYIAISGLTAQKNFE